MGLIMKEICFRTTNRYAYTKQIMISYIICMKYVKITHNSSVSQTNVALRAKVTSIEATLLNLIWKAPYLYLWIEMVCSRVWDENGLKLTNRTYDLYGDMVLKS